MKRSIITATILMTLSISTVNAMMASVFLLGLMLAIMVTQGIAKVPF